MIKGGILALDLSGFAGWTLGTPGRRVAGGTVKLPPIVDPGRMFNAYGDWLADILAGTGVDVCMLPEADRAISLVVMEAPMDLQAMARCHTPTAYAYQQIGLAAVTDYICDRYEIICRQAKVNEARREILGSAHGFGGDEGKKRVVAWHQANGFPDIVNHNEADSNTVWLYACRTWAGLRRAA